MTSASQGRSPQTPPSCQAGGSGARLPSAAHHQPSARCSDPLCPVTSATPAPLGTQWPSHTRGSIRSPNSSVCRVGAAQGLLLAQLFLPHTQPPPGHAPTAVFLQTAPPCRHQCLSSHRSRVYLMWKLRQRKFPKVCGPPGPREGALTSVLQQNRLPPPSTYLESTHLSTHHPPAPAQRRPCPQHALPTATTRGRQQAPESGWGPQLSRLPPRGGAQVLPASLRPCTPAPAPPCTHPLPLPWLALCSHAASSPLLPRARPGAAPGPLCRPCSRGCRTLGA